MPDESSTLRRCQRCKVEKLLDEYHRARDRYLGRAYVCKACKRAEAQTSEFRARRRQTTSVRYARSRLIMQEMKDRPCLDCGGRFPHYVMEWDHPDRSIKSFTIAMKAGGGITPSLLAEIAKCDLVCANCHRVRTRKQWEAGEWRSGRPRLDAALRGTEVAG